MKASPLWGSTEMDCNVHQCGGCRSKVKGNNPSCMAADADRQQLDLLLAVNLGCCASLQSPQLFLLLVVLGRDGLSLLLQLLHVLLVPPTHLHARAAKVTKACIMACLQQAVRPAEIEEGRDHTAGLSAQGWRLNGGFVVCTGQFRMHALRLL